MTDRGGHGRWSSAWRLWEVPELVAQVTRAIDSEDPLEVSARRFDREREAAGWPDAPTSAAIRARLGRPAWAALVETCVAPHRLGQRYRDLSRWLDPWQQESFTEREVAEGLRIVAQRLSRETLRQGEYSEGRYWLLHELTRSRNARVPILPTLTQARRHAGPDWGDVLRAAGMDTQPAVERGDAMRGLSAVDAVDLCLEVFGVLANAKQAERFASANGLRFAYLRPMPSAEERMAELIARRKARGLDTPLKPPPRDKQPDYRQRVNPDRIPERYRIPALREHTRDRALASLAGFLDQLPSGLIPTRELYAEHVRRQLDATHESAMQRRGGFVELRDEAVRLRIASRRGDT